MHIAIIFMILSYFRHAPAIKFEVPECDPPDFPLWGNYGPRQPQYHAGDYIHYFCDVDTYIGGNFLRRCEDTGDWTGDTPVCDTPTNFSRVFQSSTREPTSDNSADLAIDGDRGTCAVTANEEMSAWQGMFTEAGELIRVMIFLPKDVKVSYEVILIRKNNEEVSCGGKTGYINRLEWHFHNCPGPNNTDAVAFRIQTVGSSPLYLCEVQAHVLVSPKCVDPHVNILDGRLQLSRKTATLMCNPGFSHSRVSRLECIRDGVWTRKQIYCIERQWEVNEDEPEL